ncbi:MAG: hypothetical protein ACFB9M_06160 [Myxococcota bacterium]
MATKTSTKKKTTKKKGVAKKAAPAKSAGRKTAIKKPVTIPSNKTLTPKANAAVKKAADELWGVGVPPHSLLQELHEVLLLRCLKEADGNYAAAASLFGPSRQSVQQYANSSLRDERWRAYQQNRRRSRS